MINYYKRQESKPSAKSQEPSRFTQGALGCGERRVVLSLITETALLRWPWLRGSVTSKENKAKDSLRKGLFERLR